MAGKGIAGADERKREVGLWREREGTLLDGSGRRGRGNSSLRY